jgi:hypothetical protein
MTSTPGNEDILRLIPEAAKLCEKMSVLVDAGAGGIDELLAAADGVGKAIETRGDELRKAIRTLTTCLTTAHKTLEQADDKAAAALVRLADRATEVQGETAGLAASVKEGTGKIEEAVDNAMKVLHDRATGLGGRLDDLAETMTEVSEGLATRSSEAKALLADLAKDFDLECGVLAEQKTEWFAGVTRIVTELQEHGGKAVGALGGLLSEHAPACVAWGNEMVKDHNQAMAVLSAAFEEEPATAPLLSELQGVADAAREIQGRFSTHAQATLDRFSNLTPELIDLTASLGPLEGL